VVLNGKGLLTGRNTGIILSPAEPDSGIQFQTLDGTTIPGHITALENFSQSVAVHTFTANSTVLAQQNRKVRTVEHLMAALFMAGLDNVLVKADEEIPNIDGSALDFAKVIAEAGTVEQDAKARTLVIHEKILVGIESSQEKHLYAEPAEGFEIQMRVDYPAPIHEQVLTFNPERDSFYKDIAPARSFNTFENIDMAQKQGTVGSGYLNSHIILHDNKVINTELRFPDEFVRHKILDLLGDLFLIGHSVRGRVVANMTSHGYNQALVQKLHQSLASTQS
jgi:UDP-3-O-[3-hydroxymyristoyl] N-acetylglucosamine deacetylase